LLLLLHLLSLWWASLNNKDVLQSPARQDSSSLPRHCIAGFIHQRPPPPSCGEIKTLVTRSSSVFSQ